MNVLPRNLDFRARAVGTQNRTASSVSAERAGRYGPRATCGSGGEVDRD
jgi:hypothetical protein